MGRISSINSSTNVALNKDWKLELPASSKESTVRCALVGRHGDTQVVFPGKLGSISMIQQPCHKQNFGGHLIFEAPWRDIPVVSQNGLAASSSY